MKFKFHAPYPGSRTIEGKSLCGLPNVDTTKVAKKVNCKRCLTWNRGAR